MTTDLFGPSPAILSSTTAPKRHGRRLLTLGFVASTAAALLIGGMSGTASAAPISGDTVATVAVSQGLTLTAPDNFTLSGIPGETVDTTAPVTYNVLTNDDLGYDVSVSAGAAAALVPSPVNANGDVIPITALTVRESGAVNYTALAVNDSVTVHSQGVRSASNAGDSLSTDYQMVIPNVVDNSYLVTLTYLATARTGV